MDTKAFFNLTMPGEVRSIEGAISALRGVEVLNSSTFIVKEEDSMEVDITKGGNCRVKMEIQDSFSVLMKIIRQ